jgi:hypothetical protein
MLAGEVADELFGGYPWHKISKFSVLLTQSVFNLDQGKVNRRLIEASLRICGLEKPDERRFQRMANLSGGLKGWNQFYGLNTLCMQQFMRSDFLSLISNHEPYEDIGLNSSWLDGLSRFNRKLKNSQRVQLSGLLLPLKVIAIILILRLILATLILILTLLILPPNCARITSLTVILASIYFAK